MIGMHFVEWVTQSLVCTKHILLGCTRHQKDNLFNNVVFRYPASTFQTGSRQIKQCPISSEFSCEPPPIGLRTPHVDL